MIHSEFMTHRAVSKNSASSRAIPVLKNLKQIWSNPAAPSYWGKNKAGMGANEELSGWRLVGSKIVWDLSGKVSCGFAYVLSLLGGHKQHVNRIVEPWSYIKVVATATDWDNFFHLRCHKDAQPEIQELANKMYEAYSFSVPDFLKDGQWHLPYVGKIGDSYAIGGVKIDLESAKKISVSLCAQTSYRLVDDSLKKAIMLYDRLVESKPVHASPTEHQATPSKKATDISGNLRGWIQLRQLIPGNVCESFKKDLTKV